MIYVFGDSFSNPGYGATTGHGYVSVLQRLLGSPAVMNYGINGGQVADQTTNLCSVNIAGGDRSIVELGTNDHIVYKTDAIKMGYYTGGLRAVLAYLATPNKIRGRDVPAVDVVGNWQNTPSFGIGRMATAAGSRITFRVSGTTVYLGTIQFDGIYGEFSVTIDGANMGTFEVNAPGMMTQLNMPCGQRTLRFAGLTAGTHEVVMTMTGGQYIYAEWCAGNDQSQLPAVYACDITRMTAPTYAARPPLSDGTVQQYNSIISSIIGDLCADGLNVTLVDNSSIFYPDVDTYADGLHPNDTGHCKLAMNLFKAMA